MNEQRDWRGPVALVLAVGLAVGWSATLVVLAVRHAVPFEGNAAAPTILGTIGGIMGGAVAGWLGGRRSVEHHHHYRPEVPRSTELGMVPDDEAADPP